MGDSKAMDALFTGPRRVILRTLFGEPERCWNLPEIAGRAGLRPSSVLRHLRQFRESGLLYQLEADGIVSFRANSSCPVFAELQALVAKLTRAAGAGETILIVEDQAATAKITRILLESWGYRVLEAHSGTEALELLEHRNGEIHLLLTDVIMPGMTGPQVAVEMQHRLPGLRVVFMSGYPAEELSGRKCAFLPKPFNPASLSKTIRQELDRRAH